MLQNIFIGPYIALKRIDDFYKEFNKQLRDLC